MGQLIEDVIDDAAKLDRGKISLNAGALAA
jgi:hypothetical protein